MATEHEGETADSNSGSGASAATRVRVAAVQVEARVGDVAHNIRHAEALATLALEKGAKLVALPEFFSGRIVFDERVWESVLPAQDNVALDMMRTLARRYDAYVGGSMLLVSGSAVHNTYCLVAPDGHVDTHRKDLPTMWENAFYVGGNDDGIVDTKFGKAGLAVCWELIRNQTIRRLAGRVRFAITGNQWWGIASNWPGAALFGAIEQYNRYLAENAPVEFARLLGVPVLHASHCGSFAGRMPITPWSSTSVSYVSEFVGATQIVDATGRVLAARNAREGAGIVNAEIDIGPLARTPPLSSSFWTPNLTLMHKLFWHHQNACGKAYYRRMVGRRITTPRD